MAASIRQVRVDSISGLSADALLFAKADWCSLPAVNAGQRHLICAGLVVLCGYAARGDCPSDDRVAESDCLVKLARAEASVEQRRALYLRVIGRLYAKGDRLSETLDTGSLVPLAEALIEVGKIDDDPVRLLQAVEHLTTFLQAQPSSLDARLRLAQAYALLGQAELAEKQLEHCRQQDAGQRRAWVAGHPEFELLGEVEPDSPFKPGVHFHRKAQQLDPLPGAVGLYQRAIEKFRETASEQPDHYGAQLLWADALSKLSRLATNATERQSLADAARERFAVAAQCSGKDWRAYYHWARLLTTEAGHEPAPAVSLLVEASALYDKSLALALYRHDKAKIEHDAAMCLILLAERTPATPERRALYQKAIARIESAIDKSPRLLTAQSHGSWGLALLQLGKLERSRQMLRQAAERLDRALQLDSGNNTARYNLVCAYALLDQPENALRHLRLCLENDLRGVYRRAAADDEDLWSLRRTKEYNELFGGLTGGSDSFDQPISPKSN